MSHAEKCPVCGGAGKLQPPGFVTTTIPQMTMCHGCWGRGWVEVDVWGDDLRSDEADAEKERTDAKED